MLLGTIYIVMPIVVLNASNVSSIHELRSRFEADAFTFLPEAVLAAINFAMATLSFQFLSRGATFRRVAVVTSLLLVCDRILHTVSVYLASVHGTLSVPMDLLTIMTVNLASVLSYGVLSYALIRIHAGVAGRR